MSEPELVAIDDVRSAEDVAQHWDAPAFCIVCWFRSPEDARVQVQARYWLATPMHTTRMILPDALAYWNTNVEAMMAAVEGDGDEDLMVTLCAQCGREAELSIRSREDRTRQRVISMNLPPVEEPLPE